MDSATGLRSRVDCQSGREGRRCISTPVAKTVPTLLGDPCQIHFTHGYIYIYVHKACDHEAVWFRVNKRGREREREQREGEEAGEGEGEGVGVGEGKGEGEGEGEGEGVFKFNLLSAIIFTQYSCVEI